MPPHQLSKSPAGFADTLQSLQHPVSSIVVDLVTAVVVPSITDLNATIHAAVDLDALSSDVTCVIQHTQNLPSVEVLEGFIDFVEAAAANVTALQPTLDGALGDLNSTVNAIVPELLDAVVCVGGWGKGGPQQGCGWGGVLLALAHAWACMSHTRVCVSRTPVCMHFTRACA